MEHRGEGLDPFQVARDIGRLESELRNRPSATDLANLRLEIDRDARRVETRLKELLEAQGARHLKEVEAAFELLRSEIDKKFDHAEATNRETVREIVRSEFEANQSKGSFVTPDRALLVGGIGLLAVLSDPNLARLIFQMLS